MWRWRLRTLMAAVCAVAIMLGSVRAFAHARTRVELVSVPLLAGLAWSVAGAQLGPRLGVVPRRRIGLRVLLALTLLGIMGLLYSYWTLARTEDVDFLMGRSRHGWPWPDQGISDLNRWFDARYPAPRGSIKLHSEIPRVQMILHCLNIALASATSLCLGLIGRVKVKLAA